MRRSGPITRAITITLLLLLSSISRTSLLAQTAPESASGAKSAGDHNLHHDSDQGYQHSFHNAEDWAKEFDDPARDAWQKPDQILNALQLQPASRVADLGAGTGYFSARIARRISEGKLFAVDIEPGMVGYLQERAHREHLHVLVPVLATAASPNLPEPVDVVLVIDTYHRWTGRLFCCLASVAATRRPACDRGFQTRFTGGPAARTPDPARKSDRRAHRSRLFAHRST
jgi:SAM-dependent methyltransferase